jgi:SAM-dependent methyltransferase
VLAIDLDPRFLVAHADSMLTVRQHDITADPLPAAAFDLVHARLVLMHLPARERALAILVHALRPGGLSEEYLMRYQALLAEPLITWLTPLVVATWGRRPPPADR